jgi:hypothetical protein
MSDNLSLNSVFGYDVQRTAEWRWQKAEQFSDARNEVAAKELERLAEQIEQLEGSEIHKQICDLQDCINRLTDGDGDVWVDISRTVSAELRSIGFHNSYTDGAALLEWYRELLQETIGKLIADNDPGVKAAGEAWERASEALAEAKAKALAAVKSRKPVHVDFSQRQHRTNPAWNKPQ